MSCLIERCTSGLVQFEENLVTLSVTEAEIGTGVTFVQDMMYIYNLLVSMGLQVQLSMILDMDNQGAVDLAWSVGGRTHHVDVHIHYIRELKQKTLIRM